jgi:P4 family phage/plasmid primase-like protien
MTDEQPAPQPAPEAGPPAVEVKPSEDGLALIFSDRHQNGLRYVAQWGTWLRWSGARWKEEHTLSVYDLARDLLRDVKGASRSAKTVNAVVELARSDRRHARLPENFDVFHDYLNTPGGVVDLRNGKVCMHERTAGPSPSSPDAHPGSSMLHLTKITPFSPSSSTGCPTWLAAVDTWTKSDAQLVAFLKRLSGYFATGHVTEHVLPIVFGSGGNGKSVFVETLRAVLGEDFVTGLPMESLIFTRNPQHPTDIAGLRGKRLAVAVETEEGHQLAEAKIKFLTGGDKLVARFMRQDFFTFTPTHKILIVGNHRPVLRNVDEAMRRRVLLIDFDAVIPAEKRDKDLAAKLRAEGPAILQWIIDGAREWYANGLNPPESVRASSAAYFEAQDSLGEWMADCLVVDSASWISKKDLFDSWKAWAEEREEWVGRERQLTERLARVEGIREERYGKARTRGWRGLRLRGQNEEPESAKVWEATP